MILSCYGHKIGLSSDLLFLWQSISKSFFHFIDQSLGSFLCSFPHPKKCFKLLLSKTMHFGLPPALLETHWNEKFSCKQKWTNLSKTIKKVQVIFSINCFFYNLKIVLFDSFPAIQRHLWWKRDVIFCTWFMFEFIM